MKKITTAILIFATFSALSLAQIKTSVTTEEEYNYMTKGYSIQLSSGLDMKRGYATGISVKISQEYYAFNFIPLYKVTDVDSALVGHIVKAFSKSWDNTYWYGFPIGDQDLLNRTFKSISKLDESMTTGFFKAYAEFNLIK